MYSGYEALANQLLLDNPGVAPEAWDFTSVAQINKRAATAIAALPPPVPTTPAAAAVVGVSAASAIVVNASPAAALAAASAPAATSAAASSAAAPSVAAPATPAAAPLVPGPQALTPAAAAAAAVPAPPAGIKQRLEALEVRFAGSGASAAGAPGLLRLDLRLGELEVRVGVAQPLSRANMPHRLAALEAVLGFAGGAGAPLLQRLEALEVAVDGVAQQRPGSLLARVGALEAESGMHLQGDVSARLAALERIFLE